MLKLHAVSYAERMRKQVNDLRYSAKSDTGKTRPINQDCFKILDNEIDKPVFLIIADGMGGHNSGEVASKLAVESVSEYINRLYMSPNTEILLPHVIKDAMLYSNDIVFNKSKENNDFNGMGTTLILAAVINLKIYIGHIGDSRAYLLRNGEIRQLTTDHSLIEELVKSGSISRDEAENHPRRNVITKALGCTEDIQVDISDYDIISNDIILLCTDGLTKTMDNDDIKKIIKDARCPEIACEMLIKKANENGGEDNTTVVVAYI